MEKKRIGVLTGGGDCARIESALSGLFKTAMDEPPSGGEEDGTEVRWNRDGWQGRGQSEGDEDYPASRSLYT